MELGFEPHGSNLIPECGQLPPTLPGPTHPAWGACAPAFFNPSPCHPAFAHTTLLLHQGNCPYIISQFEWRSGRCCPWPPHLGSPPSPAHGTHLPFTAHATTRSFRLAFTRLTTIVHGRWHLSASLTSQPTALGRVQPITTTITTSSSIMDHVGHIPGQGRTHLPQSKPLGSSQLSTHFTHENTEVFKRQARTCTCWDEPTTAQRQGSSP